MDNQMYAIGLERARLARLRWIRGGASDWRDLQDEYGNLCAARDAASNFADHQAVEARITDSCADIMEAKRLEFGKRLDAIYARLDILGHVAGYIPQSLEAGNLLKEASRLSTALDNLR